MNLAIARELSGDRTGAIAGYRDFLARTVGDSEYDGQRQAARRLLARLEDLTPETRNRS